jgi:hypothetical protein
MLDRGSWIAAGAGERPYPTVYATGNRSNPPVLVPALLVGFIFTREWYIWLGLSLWQAAKQTMPARSAARSLRASDQFGWLPTPQRIDAIQLATGEVVEPDHLIDDLALVE